jgi:hypothetical protein
MSIKLGLFIQALVTFILGLFLVSMGLPSSEADIITETGGQIMDALDDVSDSPEVHNIAENSKSSFRIVGFFISIFSILELIILGISMFK